MAKEFYSASQDAFFAAKEYQQHFAPEAQQELQKCLFDVMCSSEEVRLADGTKVGPFNTVDEMMQVIKNEATVAGDRHLLVFGTKKGSPHLVKFDAQGNIMDYPVMGTSPESYLNEYCPAELQNVPPAPGLWDKIVDWVKSGFGGRDKVVKEYEDYQTRRGEFLKKMGFREFDGREVVTDVALEPTEEEKAETAAAEEAPAENPSVQDASYDVQEREIKTVRNLLRPESLGYSVDSDIGDWLAAGMHTVGAIDLNSEPAKAVCGNRLEGSRLERDWEPYTKFAQEIFDLASGRNDAFSEAETKKLRDAITVMGNDGNLEKLLQGYKAQYERGNKIKLENVISDAVLKNDKSDLVNSMNKEMIKGENLDLVNDGVSFVK